MKFKEIYAYRMINPAIPQGNLVKHMLTETSICSMRDIGDPDHFIMELTNGVNLKVPGNINEFRNYLDDSENDQ